MTPAIVMTWVWSIAKLVVDGLLDPARSTEDVLAEAGVAIAAFKAVQAAEDQKSQEKYPRYRP